MRTHPLKSTTSGPLNSEKGTCPVLILDTHCHTTESVALHYNSCYNSGRPCMICNQDYTLFYHSLFMKLGKVAQYSKFYLTASGPPGTINYPDMGHVCNRSFVQSNSQCLFPARGFVSFWHSHVCSNKLLSWLCLIMLFMSLCEGGGSMLHAPFRIFLIAPCSFFIILYAPCSFTYTLRRKRYLGVYHHGHTTFV